MFHVYGLLQAAAVSLHQGIKLLTMPIFDYDLFLHTLKEKRPSGVTLVPPLAARMALDPNCTRDHLSSLRIAYCGGAPISREVESAFKAKTPSGFNFSVGYAMTECASISRITGAEATMGSSGGVVANLKAKLVDLETGETVGPGQKGEICVKAPQTMQGYYKNPAATAEMLDEEGWLHTGDVGFHDEKGHLYVNDRKKDLIKHKGFQVSPAELEEVILQVPGVQEVCVIGVPCEKSDEVPKAFIVVKEGHKLSECQVHDLVNKKLSSYKSLKGGIEIVGALPTNPTGKVLRRALRNS